MKKDTTSLLFVEWLLERGNAYDIKTIFPDSANSPVQKDVAQVMVEDAFELENISDKMVDDAFSIDISGTESVTTIDAMFNLEISKRVIEELEERRKILSDMVAIGVSLQEDEIKWSHIAEDEQNKIASELEIAKQELAGMEERLSVFTGALNDEQTVKDFMVGKLSYRDPVSDAKMAIEKKEEKELFNPDVLTASALLEWINSAISRLDAVISRCSAILGMTDDEIIQENIAVEDALGADKLKEVVENRSIVVDTNSNLVETESVKQEVSKKIENEADVGAEPSPMEIKDDLSADELDDMAGAIEADEDVQMESPKKEDNVSIMVIPNEAPSVAFSVDSTIKNQEDVEDAPIEAPKAYLIRKSNTPAPSPK